MPTPLIESIPNFSEARRPEVVEALLSTIAAAGVTVLDHHSDTDHNRTVITYLGEPKAVEEAAFQAIKKAAELIDLDQHSGTHPRIGATDVVPFVPIAGVTMDDCVALARRLGERVGGELGIPVYLYEEAATSPERTNLENIRRGQYEGLKMEIETQPERKPDFGPARLGPAGATVIGARHPLIAFNVYLNTPDVAVAKAIAKKIRASSGGLPSVKALGMLVEGLAQVSMNLTNFRQTSVAKVVEEIRQEAKKVNVEIHHSELVGLIPEEALIDAAVTALQLQRFKPDQILEYRLREASRETEDPIDLDFLNGLASASPTPGGGAAAAYVGAMSAALVSMVARLTVGRPKYAEVDSQMNEILKQSERLRQELTRAVSEDSAAFEAVMAAFKLPKETQEEQTRRAEAIEAAMLGAAQVPLAVAQKVVTVLALAERCVALGNLHAISDGASAASMARAALASAGFNVRANVAGLADKTKGENLMVQLSQLEKNAARLEKDIQKTLQERGRLSLA
jgi:glutamate formiminotransferase/formiminotetrahydrofolate cyclodeaminase